MKSNHSSDKSNTGAVETPRSPMDENRYRTLFEHSPDGILIADPNSQFIDANPSMFRMLGYARDELIGLHASDIVMQEEIPHIGPALDDIKAGLNYRREWQFRRKDGSTFGAEVFASMLPEGNLLAMVRDISARNQTDITATWLAAIVESSDDAIIGKDLNSIIVSWNIGAENIFGYNADEMVGTSILRLIPADRQDEENLILTEIKRGEKVDHFQTLRKTKDGRLVDVTITISPIRDATGKIIGASKIARDITALKKHEREIERISRLYAALSQVNQAIVWTKSCDELLEKICQVLVEYGGFRMAWIGWHDPETQLLVPVAECGDESGYLRSVKVYADDQPEGLGPGGTAFREGRPYISNDMLNDLATLPWREEIMRAGFRASAVFPIRLKGKVCGTLGVYSDQLGIFREQEVALLKEAAGDVSFALDSLSREEERLHIEREIKFKNTILQTQQETSLDAIMVVGDNGKVLVFNRKFIELWGLSAQIIDTHVDALVLPFSAGQTEDPEAFIAKVRYLYAHRDEESRDELQLKDGRIIDRYSAPIADEDGKYYGRIWYFRDITERKRAKAALEASAQEQRELVRLLEVERSRLVAAQRIAKVGSWETSLSTMTVIWSDETPRIFEIDPRQFKFTHQAFLELVHPEDREELDRAFANSLEHASPCKIEHRLLMPDGRIKFVEETWQVFFDDQGQAVKAIGTCQDITERKQAEKAFDQLSRKTKRREHMFSTALAAMSDFAQIYDSDGRLLYVNQPLLDLWGITLDEAVGKNFFDLGYPENLAEKLQQQLRQVFETSQRITDETPFTSSDGVPGYYEYIFSPVLEADGNISFVVGSTRDITERKRSEAALKASELRYHSLFENMLEGYAYCQTIFEQDSLRDFVYLEVNSAFGRLTGLQDVIGKKISGIIPDVLKANPEAFENYGRAALTGMTVKFETYVKALDAWLSITVYSSDREHFVAVFENITERKKAEARIIYLNRVYAVLSGINTMIVRVRDHNDLFSEACRIAVETGGFRMAMLCNTDTNTRHVVPCAHAGKS